MNSASRPRRLALALLPLPLSLTLALTGCMVGPKYVKPVVPTYQPPQTYVVAYKEADPNWHPATPADATLRGDWWTVFNDPTLSGLEGKAALQNQSLKAYAARYTEARAQIGINRAALLPTVGAQALTQGIRYSQGRPYFNGTSQNSGVADIQLPLTLSYEIDFWGRVRRNINIAKEESQATAADLQTALLSVQTELAIDYFELRGADAQTRLLADTVKDYREALRITTNRFEGGISNQADVFQARTQLQAAIVGQADIAVRRAQYEHAIAILVGQPPNSFALGIAPLDALPPSIPSGLPSQLLERRPDIAAAERRAAEANQRVGIARAAFFPTVGLSAAAGFESSTLANFFSVSNIVYALGPTLNYNLFDAGLRRGQSAQAVAGFEATSADYRQTVLTAFGQVEDNLAELRILAEEAEQQRAATTAAQGAQKIFDNRYVGGLDTYLQVVTSQNTALTNERNEIDIMRRRMDASVLLVKALGGGWTTAQLPKP